MPEFDTSANLFGLPVWAAGALAGLGVLLVAVAIARSRWSQTSSFATLGTALVAGILGLSLIDRMVANDAAAERRTFERRIADLNQSALRSGSAVACLDALAGDVVEDACEKALFASPQSVAAATSYVAARLDLLRDGMRLSEGGAAGFAEEVAYLRQAAESDRFGFVAQVLAARDGCTPESCEMFSLLESPERVIANLKERTFDIHVGRHVATWQSQPGAPSLASSAPDPKTDQTTSVNIDFPTAASIPPVSIMNNEPGMPGQNGMGPSPAVAPAPGLTPSTSPAAAETAPAPARAAAAAPAPARSRAAPTPTPRPARRPSSPPPATTTAAPQPITPQ